MATPPSPIPLPTSQSAGARTALVRAVGGARGHRTDVRRVGDITVVTLEGEISERFLGVEVGRRLRGRVLIDLAGVDRITSFGVREWLTMLRELYATEVTFARCSESFMHQLSMIRAFAGNASIQSFFAPYVCPCCGTQFSALYDAIEDRPAVEHRVPVEVDCPRCSAPTTFDDDPDLYLGVEHHLVRHRDVDITLALGHLNGLAGSPIRKAVVGEETWITLSARLDEGLRLSRALDGLEGTIVFDLSAVSGVSSAGAARFLDRVQGMGPEVERVLLVGCPYPLVGELLERHARRVHDHRLAVWSVSVAARCERTGTPRWVILDLRAPSNVEAIRRGHTPQLAADWCDGPVDVSESLGALRHLLDAYEVPLPQRARNLIRVPSLPGPAPRPLPRALPAEALASSISSLGSAPRQTASPRVANAFAGAETSPLWGSAVIVGVVSLAVGALVGTAGLVGGMLLVALEAGPALPSHDPGGWDGAPSWVNTRFARSGRGLSLVGTARAETLQEGIALARQDMIEVLLQQLANAVVRRGGFELELPEPKGLVGGQRALAMEAWDRLGMEPPMRIDESVAHDTWGVNVASRFALSEQAWLRVTDHLAETESFRGITVGRVFPTLVPKVGQDASLMVVATASWMRDAEPGDVILAVEGRPVVSLAAFRAELDRSWQQALPGGVVRVRMRRNGQLRTVRFRKPM